MTQAEAVALTEQDDEAQQILDYLRAHPEFFDNHAEELAEMPVRHASGNAVSLIERQVNTLRERNASLAARLNDLMRTARENESRVQSVNRLAECLIGAEDMPAVVGGLHQIIREHFGVEMVRLALFDPQAADLPEVYALNRDDLSSELSDFFRQGRIYCDRITDTWRDGLFEAHEELASIALVPLDRRDCLGLMALASTDETRFTPGMGQLFLEMSANLTAAALRFHGIRAS